MSELEDGMVMTAEAAKAEVMLWLDYKKVRKTTISNSTDAINNIAGAVAEGLLVLNSESFEWEQKLMNPIESTKTLTYKPRLSASEIQASMRGISSGDPMGIMIGLVAQLTGNLSGVIKKIDSEDYGICQNIALFFVPK
tara:strand:- start:24439 stop:24855 length:417 start_codon:yes stop_codon:yes gene_type:complete